MIRTQQILQLGFIILLDEEIQALKAEIDRIGQTTQFNGQNLLDGTFDMKGYVVEGNGVSIDYYSDTMDLGIYEISGVEATFDEEGKLTEVNIDKITLPDNTELPAFEKEYFYIFVHFLHNE